MFELLGLAVAGCVALLLIGVVLKVAWLAFSLVILPLKLLLGLGALVVSLVLGFLLLPLTVLALAALLGGLAIAGLGLASAFL